MRQSHLHRITYLILLALLLSGFPDTDAQVVRIMPLGNSITEGSVGETPEESQRISYRYTLYSLLLEAGYDFNFTGHRWGGYGIFPDADHAGIPGTRDQYLVRLLQDGYDERWDVQITPNNQPYLDVYTADIILLHIGTNDITHGEGPGPDSVSLILDEIDAWEEGTGNEVIVLVARILNRKAYDLTTTQYNDSVVAMVAARNDSNIHIVDMENGAGIDYEVDLHDDGIHPNESGYAKMGQKWFEAIHSLNRPPYFLSKPDTSATEGVFYKYTVTVDDDNSYDALTITAKSKPDWLTFTDNGDRTGLLSGTPGTGDVGTHSVILTLSDGKKDTAQEFTVTVADANVGMEKNADLVRRAYPVPAAQHLTLEYNIAEDGIITVTGLTGKPLIEQKVPAGENRIRLDLTYLEEGLYICRFISGERMHIHTFIISR